MKGDFYRLWLNVIKPKHPLFDIITSIVIWLIALTIGIVNLYSLSWAGLIAIWYYFISGWSITALIYWIKLAVSRYFYLKSQRLTSK